MFLCEIIFSRKIMKSFISGFEILKEFINVKLTKSGSECFIREKNIMNISTEYSTKLVNPRNNIFLKDADI